MNKEKIKKHFKNNKKLYAGFAIGSVVGGIGVILLSPGNSFMTVDSWKVIEFKWNSPTANNIMETYLIRMGHPGYVVRCVETGEKYPSYGALARSLKINKSAVSAYFNGKNPHLKGLTYENLGEAISPSQDLQRV